MAQHNLLVVSRHAQQFADLLTQAGLPELQVNCCSEYETALPHCESADILFGAPDQLTPLLPYCTRLGWVQSSWAGVKPFIDCPQRGYVLTGVKDIFGSAMAEYVLGWLLAFERNIVLRSHATHWDNQLDNSLAGKHIGILGTGSIGTAVAKICQVFGLHVRGLNSDGRERPHFDSCYGPAQIQLLCGQLDYLVALLPDTAATNKLIDASVLAALRPDAILINAGRSQCIEYNDLVAALESQHLGHAVLDVLPQEPLPPSHELWQVENLHITSHTAAPTMTEAILHIFCDNYKRYHAGEPLLHQIDFEKGY